MFKTYSMWVLGKKKVLIQVTVLAGNQTDA